MNSFSISDPNLLNAYVRSLEVGTCESCRARLMFVGHYKVGKTSLVRSLLGLPFLEEHHSTDGIETRIMQTKERLDIVEVEDWQQTGQSTAEITDNEFHNEVAANLKEVSENNVVSHKPLQVKRSFDEKEFGSRSTLNRSRNKSSTSSSTFPITERDLYHLGNIRIKSEEAEGARDRSLKPVRFTMYDFAGQVDFYATHHLFVDRKSVYILVLDITQSLDTVIQSTLGGRLSKAREACVPGTVRDFVDYWLNTVHAQTHKAQATMGTKTIAFPKVVIVLTHKDKIIARDKTEYISNFRQRLLTHMDGKVYSNNVYTGKIFIVDNRNGDNEEFSELKRTLLALANEQCEWRLQRPVRWLKLESDIHLKAQQQNKPYLSLPLVEKLSGRYSMTKKELEDFLRYHHEIGDLLYFPHSKQTVAEYVITNPQWLIDIFYKVITAPAVLVDQAIENSMRFLDTYGIAERTLLTKIWGRQNIRLQIELLVEFDLMIPLDQNYWQSLLTSQGIKHLSKFSYAVPCLMPVSDLEYFREISIHPPLLFSSADRFIPLGTFQRLVASCSKTKSWKPHGKMFYNAAQFIVKDGGPALISLVLLTQCIMLKASFVTKEFRKQNIRIFPVIASTVWNSLKAISPAAEYQIFLCPCDCFRAREECLINVQDLCSQVQSGRQSRKSVVRRLSLTSHSWKTKVANFPTTAESYHDAICSIPEHKENHLSPQQYAIWFCGSEIKQKHSSSSSNGHENSADQIFLEYSQRITSEDILYTVGIRLGLLQTEVQAVRTDNPSNIKLAGLAMLKEWHLKKGPRESGQITALLKNVFRGEVPGPSFPSTNEIESMLWKCSRRIVSPDLLYGVGVSVGLPHSEIQATITNNPSDIQLAAFRVLVKSQIMNKWDENHLRTELLRAFEQHGVANIFD